MASHPVAIWHLQAVPVAVPGTSIAVPGTTRKVAIPGSILGGCSCGGG